MTGRPRVAATRRLPEPVERELASRFEAVLNRDDRPFSLSDLNEAMASADGLLPTVTDRLTAEVLGAQPRRVRIVANFGAGIDNIDLAAAKASGIVVTNTPDVLTDCTADLAMTLLLAVARRAGEGERLVRSGGWKAWAPTSLLGTKVAGKTLGIVGLGRIGKAVARRARGGFGMNVIYYQPRPVPAAEAAVLGVEWRQTVRELLAQSDFVSLHCPATPETRHLINGESLRWMKPAAFLVNTARGAVVDEKALVEALEAGRIAGAGLDVYEHEPEVPAALKTMENVVLLPHLGSATAETRTAMGLRALENLAAFFRGDEPRDRVV